MKALKEALFSRKNIKPQNPYWLTEDDLIGDLKDVPMGVVVRMLEEQELQGHKADVKVFQNYICASSARNGFSWEDTEADYEFWCDVLENKNWKKFFKEYPKYEKYNL